MTTNPANNNRNELEPQFKSMEEKRNFLYHQTKEIIYTLCDKNPFRQLQAYPVYLELASKARCRIEYIDFLGIIIELQFNKIISAFFSKHLGIIVRPLPRQDTNTPTTEKLSPQLEKFFLYALFCTLITFTTLLILQNYHYLTPFILSITTATYFAFRTT